MDSVQDTARKIAEVIWIYALRCPLSGQIRYIGQSNQPERRLYLHIFAAKHKYYDHYAGRWLAKLLRLNLQPSLEILCRVPDGEDWRDYERRYISEAIAAGAKLTNGTKGGEGVRFLNDKDFLRAKAARKAGITAEVRARMSASMKLAWAKPEVRANQMAKHSAATHTPEFLKHLLEIAKAPKSAEGKAKQQAGRAAYWTPERRLQKAQWMRERQQLKYASHKK